MFALYVYRITIFMEFPNRTCKIGYSGAFNDRTWPVPINHKSTTRRRAWCSKYYRKKHAENSCEIKLLVSVIYLYNKPTGWREFARGKVSTDLHSNYYAKSTPAANMRHNNLHA